MRNMVKNLALAAMVLSIASLEFSCKKDGEAKASDKPVDIDLWYGAAVTEAGPPPEDWIVKQIVKDKLNINLSLSALPSSENDQDQKINAAGAANTLPDIFMVSNKVLPRLVENQLLASVDDMYDMMPNRTSKLYDADAKAFTTFTVTEKGKSVQHSFGLAQPGSIVRNEGVLIRKDWLDKLGLQVPKTTDEFLEVMKAFTFKDPDGNGKDDTYGLGGYLEVSATNEGLGRRFDPIMGAFGVAGTWNLSSAETAGLNVLKPEYFDAMSFFKQIVDAQVIDPNWLAYKKDDFRAAWKQGKFGIMREQNAAYSSKSNYAPFDKNFPDGEWLIIDPPVGPTGKSSVGTYSQSYRIYAVSKKAADAGKKEAIAKLLEWMSSDEGYYLLGWGEEGKNYVKNADGIPTAEGLADPSQAYTQSAAQPLTQLRNMVYYNSDIELASRYPNYITDVSKKEIHGLEVLRTMQSKPWTACIGQDKMPQPGADLDRFYNQGIIEFFTGTRALTKENWDAWIEDFKKQGGEDWNNNAINLAKENRYIK